MPSNDLRLSLPPKHRVAARSWVKRLSLTKKGKERTAGNKQASMFYLRILLDMGSQPRLGISIRSGTGEGMGGNSLETMSRPLRIAPSFRPSGSSPKKGMPCTCKFTCTTGPRSFEITKYVRSLEPERDYTTGQVGDGGVRLGRFDNPRESISETWATP